jgi:hypothetical protein
VQGLNVVSIHCSPDPPSLQPRNSEGIISARSRHKHQMITILFVHGTGVRVGSYEETLEAVRERISYPDFRELRVEGLPWGDNFGSLRASKSVFRHAETGTKEYTKEDEQSDAWRLLAADPMAALRFETLNRTPYAGGEPGKKKTPGMELNAALEGLHAPDRYAKLQPVLFRSGIEHVFGDACRMVKADRLYEKFLSVASRPLDPFYDALADTIVALAISVATERHGASPFAALDEDLRIELTETMRGQLGGFSAALIPAWAKKLGGAVLGGAAYAGSFVALTPYLEWRRGPFSDAASPVAGDILLYQCRGEKIRAAIKSGLEPFKNDDVVLLAHSLGGVACVDLLLDKADPEVRRWVKLLITVGSQAPYFYEINALRSLPYTNDEAEVAAAFQGFPTWVNLHNRRDFLSYVGEEVFPPDSTVKPPSPRVRDLEVHSRLPFPQSHTSYFTRAETYEHIGTALRTAFNKPKFATS